MGVAPDVSRLKKELASLVRFDTQNPPGHEVEAARYIVSALEAEGFDASLSEYRSGRANVIAKLSRGPGPVLAFNTHIDVVPCGEGWSSDPLTLIEKNGNLYGRGACDAKGPLAAMLEALRMLKACPDWSGTLMAVFTADEEVASEGAKHFAKDAAKIDFAVIGEPTSNAVVAAHKGSVRPEICVHGIAAHSGTPHLGENAIFQGAKLLQIVEAYHEQIVSKKVHPLVGNASLTVTRINGGHSDNAIPERCHFLLDRRMIPGENEDDIKREIQGLLDTASKQGVRATVSCYHATTGGATETAVDSPIVQAGLAVIKRHGVVRKEPLGFQGACDLVHFRALGATGIVLGPGDLAVAHKPDEFVPVDELVAASLIYRDIALSMLSA